MDWPGLWLFLNAHIWLVVFIIIAILGLLEELGRGIVKMYIKRQEARVNEAQAKVRIAELELQKEQERRRPKFYTVDDVPHGEQYEEQRYEGLPPQM